MATLDEKVAQLEEKRPRGFHFIGINELLQDLQPPDWLLSEWLEKGSINLLTGKPNAGKSLQALDWALCIATGTAWNGIPVDTAPVIYICGEGHRGMRRRLKAWEIEHSISLEGQPFAMSSQAALLRDPDVATDVFRQIETGFKEPPGFIVIDTLARNFGGNENDTEDMSAFVKNIDDSLRAPFNACVLIVHHTGKADHDEGRGSTALPGAVENSFKVTQTMPGHVTLKAFKIRDGEYPSDVVQEIKPIEMEGHDKFGNRFTAPVLIHASNPASNQAPLGDNQKKALPLLEALSKEYGVDAEPGEPVWVPTDKWRELCAEVGIDRRRWSEVSKALAIRGLIQVNEKHISLIRPLS